MAALAPTGRTATVSSGASYGLVRLNGWWAGTTRPLPVSDRLGLGPRLATIASYVERRPDAIDRRTMVSPLTCPNCRVEQQGLRVEPHQSSPH